MRTQTLRWALLGNAVSVDVARWLGQRLAAPFRYKYMLGPKDRKLKPAAGSTLCERSACCLLPMPPQTCLISLRLVLTGIRDCFYVMHCHPLAVLLVQYRSPMYRAGKGGSLAAVKRLSTAFADGGVAPLWYEQDSSDEEGVPEEERYSYPGVCFYLVRVIC